jgi:hypothetical protein
LDKGNATRLAARACHLPRRHAGLNLLWEVLQLPLFTVWTTGTMAERGLAVVHRTGGGLLIALVSLFIASVSTTRVEGER